MRVMRRLFILLIISLLILACGVTESPTGSELLLIIPTPNVETPIHTNTPAVAVEQEEVVPATTEYDLLLGVTEREINCTQISQIIARVLEEEVGLKVGIIEYESPDVLFEALAGTNKQNKQKEIDLTFCFLDPDDRRYLKLYPTDLKQIGQPILHTEDDSKKLLTMVNSAIFVNIHEKHCLYEYLAHIIFDQASYEEQDIERWIDEHNELLQSWGSCH